MARILYKYVGPGDENEPVPAALRTQSILVNDPTEFNDPFEVRPYFDQEAYEFYVAGHESFYEGAIGVKHSLVGNRSMSGIPVENVAGFGDDLNARFRRTISERFRVLCLSENATSPVMWGHYTEIYRGAVIGIDVENPSFAKGLKAAGYAINYTEDRSLVKLPLAFYQTPSVERIHPTTGKIVNEPMQEVVSNGITLYYYQYAQKVEDAYIAALQTKAAAWAYEREVRFIYNLPTHAKELRVVGSRHVVPLPPSCIKGIIVGDHASLEMVKGIVKLHRSGAYGKAKLHYTTCHPYRFEVRAQSTHPEYLLSYFDTIMPAKRGKTRSMRR